MRVLLIPLVCLGLLCAASSAGAGAIGLLNLDGKTVNHLEDQDWERILTDKNSNGALDVGDTIIGMVEIQAVRDVFPTGSTFRDAASHGSTFTAVFVTEVATKSFNGFLYTFTFKPAAASEWAKVSSLPTPTNAGTMVVVYDDSSNPFVNPNPVGGTGISDAIATATDGTKLWELGFINKAGEGWGAQTSTDSGTVAPGGGVIFGFGGALNVTVQHGGVKLLPHQYLAAVPQGTFHDVHFTGGLESPSVDDLKYFTIKTDTDFYIKPVPEPGSLALLGLGLVACGGYVIRRRRARS